MVEGGQGVERTEQGLHRERDLVGVLSLTGHLTTLCKFVCKMIVLRTISNDTREAACVERGVISMK